MPLNESRAKTPVGHQNSITSNRTIAARHRRMSENLYAEGGVEEVTTQSFTESIQQSDQIKKFHTRQSKKLPHWAWRILLTLLGIRKEASDRIIIGQIILLLTAGVAGVFVSSYIWYTVYDIYSEYTKSTALTGTVSIVIVLFWCTLGIYANRLLANLFRSRKLVESVRLHSKTIFKVSASFLLIVLATTITVLNNLSAQTSYSDHQCRNISLSVYVCRTIVWSRIGYSAISLLWNTMVGFVVLSVCRTHTIGIRRFIRQLEEDGRIYEHMFRQEIMEQLTKSGDFEASAGQSSLYTTTDEFFSEDKEDEDHWAEDDPLVDDLTFYPRPSTAALARGNYSYPALARRRMLHRQDSVSSISISRNPSGRSSRRNSGGSSPDEDVFHQPAVHTSSTTPPRMFERHYLSRPMETLIERSTETLNTAGLSTEEAPPYFQQTSQQNIVPSNSDGNLRGATAESKSLLSKRGQFSKAKSESLWDDSALMERELKPIYSIEVNGIDENHYGDSGNEGDTAALLTSTSDSGNKGNKDNKSKVRVKTKKSKDKKASGRNVMIDGEDKVSVMKVIDGIKRQQSVDGTEKSVKEQINTYVSDCSTDNEESILPQNTEGIVPEPFCENSWEDDNPLLTNEEIFLAYWKISCRLRSTSLALQRWLFMWIILILLWSAAFLVELASHSTKVVEIAQFILTILLIPLLCSAYGEINYEGARMIRCICPIPSRINMLKLLIQMPLEMTAFGFAVNYSSIVTTIGALGLAFFTKLLLEDMSW